MSYQSINPENGETLQTFKETTDQELEAALQTAAACFERAAIANKAADILRSRRDDFARPVTLEMGKRFEEAQAEVRLSADIIAYYAEHAEGFLAPVKPHPESGAAQIESSPLGVLLCVQPWNFPYYQLARFAAPNLMAGNVVMVKHSGTVPQCALAFEKLWREAGAPVALMFRVNDEAEAVALANDSHYGLGRSIFTQDVPRGQRLALALTRAWCLSTTRRGPRAICRSAESKTPVTAANSPGLASRSL